MNINLLGDYKEIRYQSKDIFRHFLRVPLSNGHTESETSLITIKSIRE